jgi:hypothetical protein
MKYEYLHIEVGFTGCGNVAFYYSELPSGGDIASSKKVTNLDGTKPKPGEIRVCGSCGKKVFSLNIKNFRECR